MNTRCLSVSVAPALFAAVWLTSCGDPLLTAQDRGDGVFGVHGLAQKPSGGFPGLSYQVAVIYLRAVFHQDGSNGLFDEVETEVIPGSIAGSFPAEFRVELIEAPSAYPWESNIVYGNIGTGTTDGVFSVAHSPDRVRIGQLMIGPAEEIAGLPTHIRFAPGESRTLHRTLAAYLPNTTITGYQVIYAEGVGAGDVIYPTYTPSRNESTGGLPIANGFTLVDARQYFAAATWEECADTLVGALYNEPIFDDCLIANRPLNDCLARCSIALCQQGCEAAFPDLIDEDACLSKAALPKLEASCGPVLSPRPYLVQVLDTNAPLSVVLDDDDIKAGLRILQSTTL
jgi:hypothetical protein